jgi:hypothetical protein
MASNKFVLSSNSVFRPFGLAQERASAPRTPERGANARPEAPGAPKKKKPYRRYLSTEPRSRSSGPARWTGLDVLYDGATVNGEGRRALAGRLGESERAARELLTRINLPERERVFRLVSYLVRDEHCPQSFLEVLEKLQFAKCAANDHKGVRGKHEWRFYRDYAYRTGTIVWPVKKLVELLGVPLGGPVTNEALQQVYGVARLLLVMFSGSRSDGQSVRDAALWKRQFAHGGLEKALWALRWASRVGNPDRSVLETLLLAIVRQALTEPELHGSALEAGLIPAVSTVLCADDAVHVFLPLLCSAYGRVELRARGFWGVPWLSRASRPILEQLERLKRLG